jgi:hypothetical protein
MGGRIAVCPITAAKTVPQRSTEVLIPVGEAGQTKPGLILCHQLRTLLVLRAVPSGQVHYLTNPEIRANVREGLAIHLGLDIPGYRDGASKDDCFSPDSSR